jgi:thiosulfate/3-mercaptopyruvate sulfurtransferase
MPLTLMRTKRAFGGLKHLRYWALSPTLGRRQINVTLHVTACLTFAFCSLAIVASVASPPDVLCALDVPVADMATLISGAELEAALDGGEPPLVFDCRNFFRTDDPRDAYAAGHIPTAGYLESATDLAEDGAPFANTRPTSAEALSASLGRLGLGSTSDWVVLYGRGPVDDQSVPIGGRAASGMMWATRCWWVLRSWGFTRVAILDGGFDRWLADGRAVTTGVESYPSAAFDASTLHDRAFVSASREAVLERVQKIERGDKSVVLLDSLPTASYEGTGTASNGRRQGHIMGAVSLPYGDLFDSATGLFLPAPELSVKFQRVGITKGVPVLAY